MNNCINISKNGGENGDDKSASDCESHRRRKQSSGDIMSASSSFMSAIGEKNQHLTFANYNGSSKTCSEGSITPTNTDGSVGSSTENANSNGTSIYGSTISSNYNYRQNEAQSKCPTLKAKNGNESIYSSITTLSRSGRIPPQPPVRRTSSISDPNAITLGTLRSAGVSTYEEIKSLKQSMEQTNSQYEELNAKNGHANRRNSMSTSLTSLADSIYSSLDSSFSSIHASRFAHKNPFITKSPTSDYNSVSNVKNGNSNYSDADEGLPPPPSEAYGYSDTESHYQSGHKSISKLRKEFLQTLNEKLSNPLNQRMSPNLGKRHSISNSEQEWDSDSSLATSTTQSKPNISSSSQIESLAHSLVRRLSDHGGSNNSNSSSSSSLASSFFRRQKSGDSSANKKNLLLKSATKLL